jgi:oligoribonuclease
MLKSSNRFVWIDLEMTGLDPECDVILEIACIISDDQLAHVFEGPSLVIHQPDEKLAIMPPKVKELHEKSGLTHAVRLSSVSLAQANEHVLDFIKEYCVHNTGILCGNSIWQDRRFLQKYMPDIIDYLNYRMIDVSAIKECIRRWYPAHPAMPFVKKENHRALEDIQESLAELRYYREHFFIAKEENK